jgi:transposase-like protein
LPLTAEERAELTRLRRENAKLENEREILKAAAFFVTESTRRRGLPSSTGRRPTTTSPRCAGS